MMGMGMTVPRLADDFNVNVLDNYGRAAFLFDAPRSTYRNGTSQVGLFSSLTGLTFTRALAAYGQTSAGALTLFGSGAPRITDKGLLIEGARTNLCLRSQEFDDASWSKTNITLTQNAIAAPDGTTTADLCTVASTAATNFLQGAIVVSGTNCCASIYVQNVNRTGVVTSFVLYDQTAAANKVSCSINWSAMTVSGTGASIERLGSTNWYRIIMIDTAWTSGNTGALYVGAVGSSLAGGLAWYLWGAQVEAAAFPSSYIPTTTASVTRPADVCSIAVSGFVYPVTLFAEFERVVDTGGVENQFQIDDGSAANRSILYLRASDALSGRIVTASADQMDNAVSGAVAIATVCRSALRVAANDGIACRAGMLSTQDTSVTLPSSPTVLRIGINFAGSEHSFGYTRRLAVWSNLAFTDAQLAAVST